MMSPNEVKDLANSIAYNAHDMFPKTHTDESFTMYSWSRPAEMFWTAVVAKFVEAGMTEPQIQEALKSKDMRWMLDNADDAFNRLVDELVTKPNLESIVAHYGGGQ